MSANITRYDQWEHGSGILEKEKFPEGAALSSKRFGAYTDRYCYEIGISQPDAYSISLGYYIGVDWLCEGHSSIVVAPKLNTRPEHIREEAKANENIELDPETHRMQSAERAATEIDYFAMLQTCLSNEHVFNEIDNLVQINWNAKEVPIRQAEDWLSPLLIVKFLNVLRSIVRKGLKKAYYSVEENLRGKVKGKILVAANIKTNVLKNRLISTVCSYQEFGADNTENRLLHKAFQFACSFLDNNRLLFGRSVAAMQQIQQLTGYCRPAFEHIGSQVSASDLRHYKPNPFFREYTEGIRLAKLILRRYAYTIANTAQEIVSTPPYWIDMPRLFELYALSILKGRFSGGRDVIYHFSARGNELDFLINTGSAKMVADAKYKPLYRYGKDHTDMRQLSGYARLEKVAAELRTTPESLIDCLIIYPDLEDGHDAGSFLQADLKSARISGYRSMYKLGIKLPVLR